MAKTVRDILDEIRMRADTDNIDDAELLEYINDLEVQFMESLFPAYSSVYLDFAPATYQYDISAYTAPRQILKVLVDSVVIPKKRSQYDDMDGWYASGDYIVLSQDYIDDDATGMTIVYRTKLVPHLLENASTDSNMAAPDAFHDLYVFHVLAQVSSKLDDTVAYTNYQSAYNTLLAEASSVTTQNQLSPIYIVS